MKALLTLIITLVASAFIVYGSVQTVTKEGTILTLMFGIVAITYGLLVFATLISILISDKPMKTNTSGIAGIIFLLSFLLVSVDHQFLSNIEMSGLLITAICINVNWLFLRKLVALKRVQFKMDD